MVRFCARRVTYHKDVVPAVAVAVLAALMCERRRGVPAPLAMPRSCLRSCLRVNTKYACTAQRGLMDSAVATIGARLLPQTVVWTQVDNTPPVSIRSCLFGVFADAMHVFRSGDISQPVVVFLVLLYILVRVCQFIGCFVCNILDPFPPRMMTDDSMEEGDCRRRRSGGPPDGSIHGRDVHPG